MDKSTPLIQHPPPGSRLLMCRGDIQTFTLTLSRDCQGSAWLRTTIGHARLTRKEIVEDVAHDSPGLGRAWFDIPMIRVQKRRFELRLPLCEVGHFEAKCFFLKKGELSPIWPQGSNTVINVEPADTCCANVIYNAFVRQFGTNKDGSGAPDSRHKKCIQTLDKAGYSVIPKSGTFRDLISELDFIIGELGCRIIQLLPIHPTPTTYGRMGRFGSPFAALSFTAVDPALAEFDPRATPLEQFIELVDAIHQKNAKVFIDIAINHTGWAATIHETHPHWLVRDTSGKIEVPGAWGVRWEDLTKLDYRQMSLWQYMADVFLVWCRRGVDGFRCDAGYMIPVPAWKYIIAQVRMQFPDTIFLLEGLGGKISVTRDILNLANFNWAYSELFQNYDRSQIENYLPGAIAISQSDGITVHFAETHDNPRLAARSKTYAKMRTALCALCAPQGAFGFANGVEWFATEKINVHEAPSINWGAADNQIDQIGRINNILKHHPCFHDKTELKLVQEGPGNFIVLFRHHLPTGKKILVLANLADTDPTVARWNCRQAGIFDSEFTDLLSAQAITPAISGERSEVPLDPGKVLCLTPDADDVRIIERQPEPLFLAPRRIEKQRIRAKALDVFNFYHDTQDLGQFDIEKSSRMLAHSPEAYCRQLNPAGDESRTISWRWPDDEKREVMIPPNHFLLVLSDVSFRAYISDTKKVVAIEESLRLADGTFFTLFNPLPVPEQHTSFTLKLAVYTSARCHHADAPLLLLASADNVCLQRTFHRPDFQNQRRLMLGTNGRGGMLRAHIPWGTLISRYDALLAANLHPELPEDRWIMLSRCRLWLVFQDYSQEINRDCQTSFHFDYHRGIWRFQVPTGQGQHIVISIALEMLFNKNAVRMSFYRHPKKNYKERLNNNSQVRLILRPDIEDRNFHHTTKAYMGPEDQWPASVTAHARGFTFAPHPERRLEIQVSKGDFVWEPEWQYMVHRSLEQERGLDPDSDLFSPGYFSATLNGKESLEFLAQISGSDELQQPVEATLPEDTAVFSIEDTSDLKLDQALNQALDAYVIQRNALKTVIAGYPWFLDWGRDSLIVVRGLIATGRTDASRAILKQFGQYEMQGTLPNMIRGQDAGNRNTSDAPLWFFLACADLVRFEGNEAFLEEPCEGRTVRQILISMGQALKTGTPNGIRMDPKSGLIFSPAHFSWMDTNHPAATPREGYPVEIQALWHHAVKFLSRIDSTGARSGWKKLATKIQASINKLFVLSNEKYLSDCLHAAGGTAAVRAEPDDALRPNQLLAVTLGAVSKVDICRNIVETCKELLIPGGIRSLADRPVRRPLAVYHNNMPLNDPQHPYRGIYTGDEDTSRKPAYHNGTAWTWLFPSFCEAWVTAYGEQGKNTALSWLTSAIRLINRGCIGHIPEILDGDFPHTARGCDAQAWGTSELLRVWTQLTG